MNKQTVKSFYFLVGVAFYSSGALAANAWPVDEYGQNCLSITESTSERAGYGSSQYTKHIIVMSNRCDHGFTIKVHTHAGWTGYMNVPAGGTGKWYCTDGLSVNRDCHGVDSFTP